MGIDIVKALTEAGIEYTLFEHPAVFTVEEGKELLKNIPGHGTKNLFLVEEKGSGVYLFTVCEEIRVDLKALAISVGVKRFSFGSPELLQSCLELTPGSVTPLGLVHDSDNRVNAYIDENLADEDLIQVHPLRNTATVVLKRRSLTTFLESYNINIIPIPIPTRT